MNPWLETGAEVLLAVCGIYFACRLARFAMYARALTPDEIAASASKSP